MCYEKSCGFIAFSEVEGKNYYLLIKGLNRDIGFPKGHVEGNENELETARRELKEETNIEVEVIDGFRWQIDYRLPRAPGVMKKTVYFLGRCKDTRMLRYQREELRDAFFLPYDEAVEELTFDVAKEMLKEAEAYLKGGCKSNG